MAEAGCRFISGDQCELGNPDYCAVVSVGIQEGQYDKAQQLGVEIQEVYDYPDGGVEGIYPVVRLCQRALHRPDVVTGVAEMAGIEETDLNYHLEFVVSMNRTAKSEREIGQVLGTETVRFNTEDHLGEDNPN